MIRTMGIITLKKKEVTLPHPVFQIKHKQLNCRKWSSIKI